MQLDPKALRSALDAYHASLPTHDYPSRWAMEEAITAYRLALPQEPSSASMGVAFLKRAFDAWIKAQPDGSVSNYAAFKGGYDFRRAPSPSPAPVVVEALREAANIAFDEMFAVTGAPVARAVQQKILALASLSQPAKEREGEQP